MDSSKFLRMSAKGGDRFEWTGNILDLDKFFSALGYTGTWSQPTGEGNPHKFTNKLFTCTWYATKKSLLIQGKKSSDFKEKLKQALVNPVSLITAKNESESKRTEISDTHEVSGSHKVKVQPESSVADAKRSKLTEGCAVPEVQEEKEFSDVEIHDGLSPGKVIANLLQFRMKKWEREGAKVTIATPFMDKAGLLFILSCMQSETALERIYTREVCAWNNKKVDVVIAEGELSKNWIVNKIVALKKAPSFHAKFLAGKYKNKVELILTSCNMTSEHLFSDQLETVMRMECAVETFHDDWLRPLEIMAEQGNTAKFLNMDDIMQAVKSIE